ncbi:MAG: TonB-dependent receptor family protein [Gemmatimonadales bacterium]
MRVPLLLLGVLAVPAAAQRPDSTRAVPVAPLIVTVTRAPTAMERIPAAVGVLDSTALRRGRATLGLAEALNDLPGTFVADRSNYSLDQRISIRGFGSRAAFGTRGVTILLDGVPQTLPDGQSQLTNVDLGEVDEAEVLRGSASMLYGNGAGGVVSLNTAPASAAPFAARTRIEGGSFGLLKWQGWGSARRGPWSGTLSVSRTTLDGFRQQSAADLRQLSIGGEYLGSATTVRVHFRAADDPLAQNPGAISAAQYAVRPDSAATANIVNDADKAVTQQQLSVAITHFGAASARYDLTTFGALRYLWNPLAANTLVRIDRRVGGVRASTLQPLAAGVDAPTVTAGIDAQWLRDDRRNYTPGHGISTDTTLMQVEYVTEIGPFARATWAPAPRWSVQGGARYDAVTFRVNDENAADSSHNSGSRTLGAWSGSAGATFTVSPAMVPYVNVSTSYETPTTTELAIQQSGAGGFNDSLGSQRAVTWEVGARGSAPRVTWSAAAFVADIRNAIVPYQESGGRSFYTNAGRMRNEGVELGLAWRPTAMWSVSGAWTVADYRFVNYTLINGAVTTVLDGHRLAGIPQSYLRLGFRGESGYAWLALDETIVSSLHGDDANALPVTGWSSTDVRAGATVRMGRTSIAPFAALNNVWDARYVGSVTINGAGGRVLEPSPGRNVYVGMEVGW